MFIYRLILSLGILNINFLTSFLSVCLRIRIHVSISTCSCDLCALSALHHTCICICIAAYICTCIYIYRVGPSAPPPPYPFIHCSGWRCVHWTATNLYHCVSPLMKEKFTQTITLLDWYCRFFSKKLVPVLNVRQWVPHELLDNTHLQCTKGSTERLIVI